MATESTQDLFDRHVKSVISDIQHLLIDDRSEQYGCYKDFADVFSALLTRPGADAVSRERVTMVLVSLKLARLIRDPYNSDSWKDLAGYAILGAALVRMRSLNVRFTGVKEENGGV